MECLTELEAEAFDPEKPKTPVLVATDCLSEGIDLQRSFDAVIHYDLCWNPTRHEQREGRVDRFGQARPTVRALMLHGACQDPSRRNPVDERVLAVILNKEKLIRKQLGVSVPVPGDMNSITQAVLADHAAVERLLVEACARLRLPAPSTGSGNWRLDLTQIPAERRALRERLESAGLEGHLSLSSTTPCREGAQLLTRSHPLVVELAEFVAERALSGEEPELAARCAVVRTNAVAVRTTVLLLLLLRHQINQERRTASGFQAMPPLLVEECLTVQPTAEGLKVLNEAEAVSLLQARAVGNVQPGQRQMELERALGQLPALEAELRTLAIDQAALAEEDHQRVRRAAVGTGGALRMRFRCEPSLPVDVIGLFVLLPAPRL